MSAADQSPLVEQRWADELEFLALLDDGPRPPGWRMTPRQVVAFVTGLPRTDLRRGLRTTTGTTRLGVTPKFVGPRALVERCVVTLAGARGLLLVGEPGTAKSMLSELLAAAVSGSSTLTVQGTAGTTEDQLRYGWNYALLVAKGPHPQALVPSPVLSAMRSGSIARVEEVTRCLPEVQDALVSILSDRRLSVPELSDADGATHFEAARGGFNVIATANLRDRGVSEMSAALKRRFNFEVVEPIADRTAEVELVTRQAEALLERSGVAGALDTTVIDALVATFRDLRVGRSDEGWTVERPTSVLSTAEAVNIACAIGLQAAYLRGGDNPVSLLPGYLRGAVRKDDAADQGRLLGYWDTVVRRRSEAGAGVWRQLWEHRADLED